MVHLDFRLETFVGTSNLPRRHWSFVGGGLAHFSMSGDTSAASFPRRACRDGTKTGRRWGGRNALPPMTIVASLHDNVGSGLSENPSHCY